MNTLPFDLSCLAMHLYLSVTRIITETCHFVNFMVDLLIIF